jgi:hypothetical protein
MKEATGELNMTIITVIAVAAIGAFLAYFIPNVVLPAINNQWNKSDVNY